jgi:hypothetical protein
MVHVGQAQRAAAAAGIDGGSSTGSNTPRRRRAHAPQCSVHWGRACTQPLAGAAGDGANTPIELVQQQQQQQDAAASTTTAAAAAAAAPESAQAEGDAAAARRVELPPLCFTSALPSQLLSQRWVWQQASCEVPLPAGCVVTGLGVALPAAPAHTRASAGAGAGARVVGILGRLSLTSVQA